MPRDLRRRRFPSLPVDLRRLCGALRRGVPSLETLGVMTPYAHVHVKNSRPLAPGEYTERYLDSTSGQRYTGTNFDGGVVEFRPILAELNRFGYDGYLTIEYQGEADPRNALPHNVAYLRRLLNRLQ